VVVRCAGSDGPPEDHAPTDTVERPDATPADEHGVVRAAASILTLLVPIRIGLDLLWWVELPGGWTVAQLGGGAIALVLLILVALRWRGLALWSLRAPALAVAAALAVGLARSDSGFVAVREGLLLATPVAFVAAWFSLGGGRRAPVVWVWSASVPVAISLAALGAGQPAERLVNGIPRLVGGYDNLHTHAVTLAVATVAALGLLRRSPAAGALAGAAGLCVVLGWVRAAFLLVLVALVVERLAAGRPGSAAAVGLGVGGAFVVAGVTVGRWADLDSGRIHIWTDAFAHWLAGGAADVVLGRGLGGQLGLHRHLDPHSDALSVLFQLGPLGLAAVAWFVVAAFVGVLRRGTPQAHHAAGLLAGLVVAGIVSNDGFSRATAALWTAGLVGWALRSDPAPVSTPPPRGE
jgi:hypothetical protein